MNYKDNSLERQKLILSATGQQSKHLHLSSSQLALSLCYGVVRIESATEATPPVTAATETEACDTGDMTTKVTTAQFADRYGITTVQY